MQNFEYYAPTRVVFGEDTEKEAGRLAKEYGATKVFVVYGGGSAEKSGLIDRVAKSVTDAGLACETFGCAKPNPTLAHAEEGRAKATDFGADFVLAVGGGSSIDTAKAVAHGVANPGVPLWDLWTRKVPLTKTIPVGAILTIAAAGSEMSDSSVLTNTEIGKKQGINHPLNRCRFAIMNPALLATVPKYHLAAGVTDIMMHTLDRYFDPKSNAELTDAFAEGLMRTVIENGRIVVVDPENYDAMAEVMWASSCSHNDLTGLGRRKDFSVHKFGHALSARFDFVHGASLSAVWGAWATYLFPKAPERFVQYARNVWGVNAIDDFEAARAGIEKTVSFFKELGMPTNLIEIGASTTDENLEALSQDATMNDTVKLSYIMPIGAKEAKEIYKLAVGFTV